MGRSGGYLAAPALLLAMVAASPSFGYTWDERFQQHYGQMVWDYFHGRLDRSAFDPAPGNSYLYGGLAEVVCVAVQKVVPLDIYVVRHAVVSAFAWVGIVFSALLATRLGGPTAGWLAGLFLVLAPRFLGQAMNNSKDAPFAAFVMVSLYCTLKVHARPPYLSWRQTIALATAIALAINVRSLGLVLIGYTAFVLVSVAVWSARLDRELGLLNALRHSAVKFAVIALIAVPAGVIAWPWAQGNPFVRPFQGFWESSQLAWTRGYGVLYAGHDLSAGTLPWHYVPVWIGLTIPPVMLTGLAMVPLQWRHLPNRAGLLALSVFVAAPVAGIAVLDSVVYDGIRQLLFLVPPILVMSAVGWATAVRVRARSWARRAALAVLVVGMAEPLIFQVRNHPNQVVYFSPLAGGPKAAFGRYDMDYWGNSILQAVRWAAILAEEVHMPLGVSGNPDHAILADAGRYRSLWFAPRRSTDYHLDIRLLRGPAASVREFAKNPAVLYTVRTADGAPLTVVLPGPAFSELEKRLNRIGGVPSLTERRR